MIYKKVAYYLAESRFYFIIMSVIILLFSNYNIILSPNLVRYNLLRNQHLNLRSDFEFKQQESDVIAYKNQLKLIHDAYERSLDSFVTEKEIPDLLDDISKKGRNSGLVFELFAPKSKERRNFYLEITLEIIVIGDYQCLVLFLNHLAQLHRLVTLYDFDLYPVYSEKKQTINTKKENNLRMKITAKIYQYLPHGS